LAETPCSDKALPWLKLWYQALPDPRNNIVPKNFTAEAGKFCIPGYMRALRPYVCIKISFRKLFNFGFDDLNK
jgi:hypothetical protein